jgi:hypothetical protein
LACRGPLPGQCRASDSDLERAAGALRQEIPKK